MLNTSLHIKGYTIMENASRFYIQHNDSGLSLIIEVVNEITGKLTRQESVDYASINDILKAIATNSLGWRIVYNWNQ